MKPLQSPPSIDALMHTCPPTILVRMLTDGIRATHQGEYLHWDKLRHLKPPSGLNSEQWWLGIKLGRKKQYRELPLLDLKGRPFVYALPDRVLAKLHAIDSLASGRLSIAPGS